MRRLLVAAIAAAGLLAVGAASALAPSDPDADHWAYAALNLPAAWELTTGSPETVIAIVDSGVDPTHPELAGAVLPGYDFVLGQPGAAPVDGHGTGVAGTAAARAGNGLGGVGACFRCGILPLQVVGPRGIALNVDIAEAIDYAVDHGAAVVNISLIGPTNPPQLEEAVARARAAGVLVVAAAGNEGRDTPQYPAGTQGAISVGASRADGSRAGFSNHGSWVRFAAPECAPIAVLGAGSGIGCGTSMSSPLVAGIVALMRMQAPYARVEDIEARLARTARAVPGTVFGIPDAAAALQLLGSPPARLAPVVLGDAAVGSELEAFSGIWVGSGQATTYQWERCFGGNCVPIDGATSARYALAQADGGRRVRAVLSVEGIGATASLQTPTVVSAPRLLSRPSISGRPRVGALLSARRGRWKGASLTFTTTWQRCRRKCEPLGLGTTYRPRPRDRGFRLRIEVAAYNTLGVVTARSLQTGVVR